MKNYKEFKFQYEKNLLRTFFIFIKEDLNYDKWKYDYYKADRFWAQFGPYSDCIVVIPKAKTMTFRILPEQEKFKKIFEKLEGIGFGELKQEVENKPGSIRIVYDFVVDAKKFPISPEIIKEYNIEKTGAKFGI